MKHEKIYNQLLDMLKELSDEIDLEQDSELSNPYLDILETEYNALREAKKKIYTYLASL